MLLIKFEYYKSIIEEKYMRILYKIAFTFLAVMGLLLGSTSVSLAKVEGDTIILGAAVSLTGKYSTNGEHTKNGYEFAIKRINDMGGVTVGGKSYKLKVIYYDDESNSGKAAQLAERKIWLQVQDAAVEALGRKGYDPEFGARPLKRIIQREVQNPLANMLLSAELKEGDSVRLELSRKGEMILCKVDGGVLAA